MAEQIHTLNVEVRADPVFRQRGGKGISGRGRGSRVMFIAKQPDQYETRKALAFVGECGQFVLQHMKRKGWDSGDIYVTYMVKVWPGWKRKPSKRMLDKSLEYLEQECTLLKPELMVALGADVMRTFGIKGSINQNMGKVFDTEYGPMLVMQDPASFNVSGKGTEVPKFVTSMDAIKTYLHGWILPPEHGGTVDVGSDYGMDIEVEDYEDESKEYLYSVGVSDGRNREAHKVTVLPPQPCNGTPIMHNAKYDLKKLRKFGYDLVADDFHCTLIQAAFLGHKPLALKNLEAIHLGGSPATFKSTVGTGKRRKQYDEVEGFLDYNSLDAWGAYELDRQYRPEIERRGLTPLYNKEKDVMRVLMDMEDHGMPIDKDQVASWRIDQKKVMGRAEIRLEEQGVELDNLDAIRMKFWKGKPKQILTAKAKKPSLSKLDLLENMKEGDEWIHDYIEWKEADKFINTYLDNWLGQDFLYPTFNQCGTQTWRFSCSNPNLQNVTKRGGSRLPYMFTAPEGYTFISADASQGELREMGNQVFRYTGNRDIQLSYEAGIDMHSMSEIIPEIIRLAKLKGQPIRTVAKSFNFKILYGGTAYGLAKEYGITVQQAQEILDGWYGRFPAVRDTHEEFIHQALTTGYVQTLVGRPLYVPQHVMSEGQFYNRAEKQDKNFPIQGGLMEIIKDAMVKYPLYLAMQVHDELLWMVPDNELEDYVHLLEEGLDSDPYDCIPYKWDIHTGKNWGEAKG